MDLSLEAYDWWGTKKNTWYRTLESNSESLNSFVHIKNKNEENLFEAYLKVWVLRFIRVRLSHMSAAGRVHVPRSMI